MSLEDSIREFIDSYDISSKSTFRCRVKHQCILEEDGTPAKLVANYGLQPGDRAYVKRDGMYNNFTIEALERIYPIVTEDRILTSLKIVLKTIQNSKSDIQKIYMGVCRTLGVSDLVLVSGASARVITYFAIDEWMKFNKFERIFEDEYDLNQIPENTREIIVNHVQRQRHQPLSGRFRIVNCGCNSKKKEPVVPSDWVGRTFKNGSVLHSSMDGLDSRKGEPPTMYCTIFSMHILEEKTWVSCSEFYKIFDSNKSILGYTVYQTEHNSIKSDRYVNSSTRIVDIPKGVDLKGFIHVGDAQDRELWIGVDSRLMLKTPKRRSYARERSKTSLDDFVKNRLGSGSVGYMSSLLQKCIRRGDNNSDLLTSTSERLNSSVPYNLPDHNFALVSGTRQMLWRSFIAIVEDAKGYIVDHESTPDAIDMRSMFLLSSVANADSEFQISPIGMVPIMTTLKNIQASHDLWDWRAYGECRNQKVLTDYAVRADDEDDTHKLQITDAICMSLDLMPMMSNDKKMLRKSLTYVLDLNNRIEELGTLRTENISQKLPIPKHIITGPIGTAAAAMDMHCNPTMLINLQSMLNLDLISFPMYCPELQRLAHFIWNNISRYNYRYQLKTKAPEDHTQIVELYSDSDIKNKLKRQGITQKSQTYQKVMKTHREYIGRLSKDCLKKLNRLQEVIILKRWPKFVKWVEYHPLQKITCTTAAEDDSILIENIGRTAWLILFGQTRSFKYKSRVYQIILASDDPDHPCKIKKYNQKSSEYVTGELRDEIEHEFLSDFQRDTVRVHPLPSGFEWKFLKKSVQISYSDKLKQFAIDGNPVQTLNLKSMIQKTSRAECITEIPDDFKTVIREVFYLDFDLKSDKSTDLIFRLGDIALFRREFEDHRVFDWSKLLIGKNISSLRKIIRIVLARIFTSDIDGVDGTYTLKTGPCDRRGKKTQNSISYSTEGIIYRIFCFLEAMYPRILKRRDKIPKLMSSANALWRYGGTVAGRWVIDRDSPEYLHLIQSFQSILEDKTGKVNYDTCQKITVASDLWEHQSKTVGRIFDGMTRLNIRGFGDASHVGAGKTLCALAMMAKLYNLNRSRYIKKDLLNHSGFLVMVPTISLIDTWKDEAVKHFVKANECFDLLIQQANGDLLRWDMELNIAEKLVAQNQIQPHSLVISTMGRVRDHPIRHPWILTVIDECLSVQNKEALQTEEAWRQSCHSEYGIIMLSATFFRSRFDKMLYMLKMLRSGLPEQRTYLDAILSEHVISNITKTDRIWEISNRKHELPDSQMKEYQRIYDRYSSKNAETLYLKLNDFIHNRVDYIQIFIEAINEAEKLGKSCAIFTKSKKEADDIANHSSSANRIGRYPDKMKHTVLSYSEGTYGLNDLVRYDTIVMRPPEPDKLPQIKGRLDRPGQKQKKLSIVYILLANTIEEAGLVRLDLCNRFYSNYLMPLAEFYELAVKADKTLSKTLSKTKTKAKTKSKSKKIVIGKKKPKTRYKARAVRAK
jgi:Mimiviridae putative helicase